MTNETRSPILCILGAAKDAKEDSDLRAFALPGALGVLGGEGRCLP
ncbi:MAG: hypothetical protein ACYTKD_21750 [Planctomycetota bacterium]|jgi:hypothetical protein